MIKPCNGEVKLSWTRSKYLFCFAHVSGDANWLCNCLKKLLPRALILTMPLMIGVLRSLGLDKILLTSKKRMATFPKFHNLKGIPQEKSFFWASYCLGGSPCVWWRHAATWLLLALGSSLLWCAILIRRPTPAALRWCAIGIATLRWCAVGVGALRRCTIAVAIAPAAWRGTTPAALTPSCLRRAAIIATIAVASPATRRWLVLPLPLLLRGSSCPASHGRKWCQLIEGCIGEETIAWEDAPCGVFCSGVPPLCCWDCGPAASP